MVILTGFASESLAGNGNSPVLSPFTSAGYFPQDEVLEEKDDAVTFVDRAGRVMLNAKPKTEK